jgi:ABC-type uncharacterized transport system substrate-binding protein
MFLNLAGDNPEISGRREAFLQGVGVIPGLTVAACFGAGDFDEYGDKAQALRDLRVDGAGPDLYFATCWPSLRALLAVAGDTPIVFAGLCDLSDDPEDNPTYEDNVYGFISFGKNLCEEWVRLLKVVSPEVERAAVLFDTDTSRPDMQLVYNEIRDYAGRVQIDVTTGINSGSHALRADLEAFANQARTPAGLIVAASVLAANNRQIIIDAAKDLELPVVYPNRLYTFSGGLISKGTYIQGLYRSAGQYARKLIHGERPSPQIDITQTGLNPAPHKRAVFETIINAQAANDISLPLTPDVLMKIKPDLIIDSVSPDSVIT